MTATQSAATRQPALARALHAYPGEVGRRAAAALDIMLRERAGGGSAWSSSRLTGDGFPVEINFTTADDRLRCTVEPARADLPPRRRFEAAVRLLGPLGSVAVPEEVAGACRRMQDGGGLRFGAWLGCRHGPDDSEYKLYVEAGDEAALPEQVALLPPRLPDRSARLCMLAYAPASGRYETYFRIPDLEPYHLPRVLAVACLDSRTGELLRFVTEAYGFPLTGRLPGQSVGVSYALEPSGAVLSVTLFFFAAVFWGADARTRQRFSELSAALGWDEGRYRAVTAPAAARRSRSTWHGIFGITLAHGGRMSLSIGVRPPEDPP
jgi:hypothetical protein